MSTFPVSPQTRWRILHTPDGFVSVQLTVDTAAPLVVSRIEQAAKNAGITLERVPPDEPSESGAEQG